MSLADVQEIDVEEAVDPYLEYLFDIVNMEDMGGSLVVTVHIYIEDFNEAGAFIDEIPAILENIESVGDFEVDATVVIEDLMTSDEPEGAPPSASVASESIFQFSSDTCYLVRLFCVLCFMFVDS